MGLENDSKELLFIKRGLLEQILREEELKPKKEQNQKGIREVKRQLTVINAEINRRNGNEEPPDLTVGLKTLNLKIDSKK